jgi:hypothetical protein
MARFIVVHHANYEKLDSFNKMVEVAKNVRESLGKEVHWHDSWWAPEDELLFCDWEAPDRQTLDQILIPICEYWPTNKIYEVVEAKTEWFS